METTRTFENIGKEDVAIAGGKGTSLGEMRQAGIPIKEGYVVLSGVFEEFIKRDDLSDKIDSILDKVKYEDFQVEEASAKIQALILNINIPKEKENTIIKSFDEVGTKFVAVRSSATSEDSPEDSWAGQLDTFLNVKKDKLIESIKKCWASLSSSRAISYRFKRELHGTNISIAVIVQKMVESEKSGIGFSVHPVTQNRNHITIEAGFGLGEAIVSGQVNPDNYVINKRDWHIIETNVNNQTKGLFRADGCGNKWKVLGDKGKEQVLNEKEIIELSKLIAKIEEHYGYPCDIEWAKEKKKKNKFYITQSRHITTLSNTAVIDKEHYPSKEDKNLFGFWDEYNPRTVYPLEYDLYMKEVWQTSLDMFDFGYGVPKIDDVIVMKENVPIQIDPLKYKCNYSAPENKIDLFKEIVNWKNQIKNLREEIGIMSELPDKEVLNNIEKVSKIYVRFVRDRMLNMNSWIDTEEETKKLFGSSDIEFNEEKLTKGLETETARMNRGLIKLALLKKKKSLAFDREFDKFIKSFSHFESERISIEDNKETILDYIENLSKSNPRDNFEDSREEFESYKRKLLKDKDKKFEYLVNKLRSSIKLRENSKTLQDTPKLILNQLVKEIGRRLAKEKSLDRESDIYLLMLEELKKRNINKSALKRREEILEEKRSLSWLPKWFKGETKFDGVILEGVSGSRGFVLGKVKIIKGPKEFSRVEKGDIIVTYLKNSLWTQLFSIISGIIVEHGTILSHASITAREFGVPCVLGIDRVTEILKEGDDIEVDANKGIVKINRKKSL